jgi:CheY-like chemotaxis protein
MKKIILLVDDTPELLRAFERSLKLMGYVVWTAQNGKDALDRYGEQLGSLDLVVTDYEMPYVKGDALCREVKSRSRVPVILLSGQASVHAVAAECGADASHSKPVRNTDLQASIERLLAP